MKAFDRFLAPGLTFDGFEGIYLNKAGRAQVSFALRQNFSLLLCVVLRTKSRCVSPLWGRVFLVCVCCLFFYRFCTSTSHVFFAVGIFRRVARSSMSTPFPLVSF